MGNIDNLQGKDLRKALLRTIKLMGNYVPIDWYSDMYGLASGMDGLPVVNTLRDVAAHCNFIIETARISQEQFLKELPNKERNNYQTVAEKVNMYRTLCDKMFRMLYNTTGTWQSNNWDPVQESRRDLNKEMRQYEQQTSGQGNKQSSQSSTRPDKVSQDNMRKANSPSTADESTTFKKENKNRKWKAKNKWIKSGKSNIKNKKSKWRKNKSTKKGDK